VDDIKESMIMRNPWIGSHLWSKAFARLKAGERKQTLRPKMLTLVVKSNV